MHPLNNGSQVENVPAPKPRVGTAGYFSESNDSGAPSYPGQDWFNAVIREFQTALSASGVAFDPNKFDHMTKAIKGISQANALAQNRLLPNQNANVIGKNGHPVPSASEYTYPAGEEIAAGWLAVTECVITKTDKALSGTGTYRRTIDGEFPDDYFGVKRLNNSQDMTGVTLGVIAGRTHIEVDLLQSGSHEFPGSSEVEGIWQRVGDEVSTQEATVVTQSNSGLIGNYETILPLGIYTSGSFSNAAGRPWSDYVFIVTIHAANDIESEAVGAAIWVSEDAIKNSPTSWYTEYVSESGQNSRVNATGLNTFSVVRAANDSVRQVIGYVKEGVV
ncbi:hypothetical protein L3V77_24805 [Vibrio sp. DW001]|uniref:hypothetical protein n=1 Tax=Vibrio sp. DW001 TaxID=2912315 RepID=UPI0023B19D42|nr:hypothetical protein [Vibrio sp. DW001]WED29151.1 hypothetical protein L3V77_24805 [Vibrio sp. DW001]